jgi:hypothetical protein
MDCLEVGDIFLYRNYGHSGTDPHYHIVIFKTPDAQVVLVYTSRSLKSVYKACRRDEDNLPDHAEPLSYVEICSADCAFFQDISAIDCNKAHMKPEDECIKNWEKKIENHKVPESVLTKVREGIKASGTVRSMVKKLL